MTDDNVTAPNAGDRFRKAQSLVVEHLDLNPQEADVTKRFNLWKRKLEIYLRALSGNWYSFDIRFRLHCGNPLTSHEVNVRIADCL